MVFSQGTRSSLLAAPLISSTVPSGWKTINPTPTCWTTV